MNRQSDDIHQTIICNVMINTTFKLRTSHIYIVNLVICLLLFDNLSAQSVEQVNDKSIFRGAGSVVLGAVTQQWDLKGLGTISQQSFPISITIPLANRMLVSINTTGMSTSTSGLSTSRGSHVDSSISSVVDTRFSLSYVLPGDKFWLTGGLNLPTGKTKLDSIEIRMMSLVSQPAFNFKTPTFGQGFNGNLGIVYAGTITRRLVLGIGASYNFKSEYEPVDLGGNRNPQYDPGDEVSTNLAFNYISYSKAARFSMDITSTYFFEDKIDDVEKYQSGLKVNGILSYSLNVEKNSHLLQTRIRYHLPNKVLGAVNTEYQASTQFEALYSFTTFVNTWLKGTLIGEYKSYTADQTVVSLKIVETGKAGIISFGGDAGFIFSDFIYPTVSIRYSSGAFVYEGASYDVSGIEAGIGIKISF